MFPFLSNKPQFPVISGRVIMPFDTLERKKRKLILPGHEEKWMKKAPFQKWIHGFPYSKNKINKNRKGVKLLKQSKRRR